MQFILEFFKVEDMRRECQYIELTKEDEICQMGEDLKLAQNYSADLEADFTAAESDLSAAETELKDLRAQLAEERLEFQDFAARWEKERQHDKKIIKKGRSIDLEIDISYLNMLICYLL